MTVKEQLHELIDSLPETQAGLVMALLRSALDAPLSQRLEGAPEDPEPLTAQEAAAVDRAWEEARAGQIVPWEELRKQIG